MLARYGGLEAQREGSGANVAPAPVSLGTRDAAVEAVKYFDEQAHVLDSKATHAKAALILWAADMVPRH
jgi:hypothetical protein